MLLLMMMMMMMVTTHYNDVIMSTMASQMTSLTIVCSTVYSGVDERKHQSSASLAFVRGIHREPVNSPHKNGQLQHAENVSIWWRHHVMMTWCWSKSSSCTTATTTTTIIKIIVVIAKINTSTVIISAGVFISIVFSCAVFTKLAIRGFLNCNTNLTRVTFHAGIGSRENGSSFIIDARAFERCQGNQPCFVLVSAIKGKNVLWGRFVRRSMSLLRFNFLTHQDKNKLTDMLQTTFSNVLSLKKIQNFDSIYF